MSSSAGSPLLFLLLLLLLDLILLPSILPKSTFRQVFLATVARAFWNFLINRSRRSFSVAVWTDSRSFGHGILGDVEHAAWPAP